jgi:hypothetical protein
MLTGMTEKDWDVAVAVFQAVTAWAAAIIPVCDLRGTGLLQLLISYAATSQQ